VNYLLDTNVVSEWVKARPDPGVAAWLANVDEDRVFLSVITLAELRHGVERLAHGARRDRLNDWLGGELAERFEGRMLSIDAGVADRWGRMVARAQAAGKPAGPMDAFLAATAERHGLTLVTRNEADFRHLCIPLVNPWMIPATGPR
jgi:predicted nucleic acid-binding protein